MPLSRYGVVRRRSEMIVDGGTIYIGGQVSDNTAGDIEAQTLDVLSGIEKLLLEAGSDRKNVLSVRILLAHRADYEGMNRVWDSWFPEGHAPTRACTLAELINPDWRLEMIVLARLPDGARPSARALKA